MVLKGIRRMLSPRRREWDVLFAEGGEKALEMLEHNEIDVIISDIRMPGMDGITLLRKVQDRYPSVIRVTLTGQPHEDYADGYVDCAHQSLVKPCDNGTLFKVIGEALRAADLRLEPRMKEVVSRISSLPTLPKVYQSILDELHSEPVDLQNVARLMRQDVGICAKVLTLANSQYFGFREKIAEPERAVVLLGTNVIKAMILSINVFSAYNADGIPEFSLEQLWGHCQRTACIARAIARTEGLDRQGQDHAFMAGLLHDLGKLIFCTEFTDDYRKLLQAVRSGKGTVTALERDYFGTTHAKVGAYLMGLWGMQSPAVDAIADHHSTHMLGEDKMVRTIVFSASILDHKLVVLNHEYFRPEVPESRFQELGLEERYATWSELAETVLEDCS